jgi:hypothetical protein
MPMHGLQTDGVHSLRLNPEPGVDLPLPDRLPAQRNVMPRLKLLTSQCWAAWSSTKKHRLYTYLIEALF